MTTQINQLTELTTTSDDDLILIREDSTGVDKRMKAQNLRAKATTKDDVGLGNVDNVSAANLRDRATHTGTQAATTVDYDNAASGLAASNVQQAIDELEARPAVEDADQINYDNAASGLEATNAQDAIDELSGVGAVASFTWDSGTTSPAGTGSVPQLVLDNLYSKMRGCTLLDDGSVNYYLNDSDWSTKAGGGASNLTGDDGQVMVEIPAFYYRVTRSGTQITWEVSYLPLSGFSLHPAFVIDGIEVSHRYYSAYDACVFDGSSYIESSNDNNQSGRVNTGSDKLASVSGKAPMAGLTRNEFRLLAANRGTGWRQLDFPLWCAVGMLYVVEYQTFFSQDAISLGNTRHTSWPTGGGLSNGRTNVAGDGNALGNGSGGSASGTINTFDNGDFVKYRGIEHLFGNVWNWADGINVNVGGTGNVHIADGNGNYADDTANNYTLITSNLTTGSDNIQDLLPIDPYFLAESVGGSDSQYITDRHFGSASSNQVVCVGGNAAFGGSAGVFTLAAFIGSGGRDRPIGGRLAR